ncbi:thiol-disulfide isomerase/thioredoxin [Chitinophaga dinghuensis]|uniref:Thiol-disulfide isomerase/thioredoxin n=1 Tax=Chitinophaga dinghuensis TaxID=1539050 RepID=A0A327WBP7_9BACT|nr:TlpA disulfide reductase family protein [Chitinophaga dinghuensis]RAJ87598.1 thiol-disulfide isomerase/thioredoxin [Chitinophaga dinghuensis]
MKQFTCTLLGLMTLTTAAFAQDKKNFQLNGKITDHKEGKVYVWYLDSAGDRTIDSIQLKNGAFTVKGKLETVAIAYIQQNMRSDDKAMLALVPGTQAFTSTWNDMGAGSVTGGDPANAGLHALQLEKKRIQQKYQVVLDSMRQEKDHDQAAAIRERLGPYFEENRQADYQFFKKYPGSVLTAYLLRFHVSDLPLKELKGYYEGLSPLTKKTGFAKEVAEEIRSLEHGSPGAVAAAFTATDMSGKSLSLSDYKGKYVLLDFWASWCVPCRKGNPHLKTVYAKYQPKGFEIVGIADDDRNEKAWTAAVEKDGLPWRHVLRGSSKVYDKTDPNDISYKFGIHSLPTKILINPEGIIIGRYGSDEEALDKKLKEIYGE